MAKLEEDTWVLVADGAKALFLRNETEAENPHLVVVRKEEQDNPATRQQGTDAPGRRPDTGTGQRSAMEDTDWHRLAEDRFADDLAGKLYDMAQSDRFERIVLVAAPKVLGEMRHKLHPEVIARVVGEVHKTLTNHPVDEIERIVAAELRDA